MLKRFSMFAVLLAALGFYSCEDKIDESNMYTFTGESIYSYLQSSQEYSDFAYLLERVKLSKKSESTIAQLLSARGNYTVFAPTNEAIQHYLDSLYTTTNYDITQTPDSTAEYITRNAIIDNEDEEAYLSTSFAEGTLEKKNMDNRYITINFDTIEGGKFITIVNTRSVISQSDIETSNGVIHGVDNVLRLSLATLPALIADADNLHIFSELLTRTGWADSMTRIIDEEYEAHHPEVLKDLSGNPMNAPKHRYFGYTAFVETDSVFIEKWGIPAPTFSDKGVVLNYDEIMHAINEKCREAYPDAKSDDLTDQDNAVNRFVAYHLIPTGLTWDKLVIHFCEMGYNMKTNDYGVDVDGYYETMGKYRRLLRITEGARGIPTNGKRINRLAVYQTQPSFPIDDYAEVSVEKEGILIMNDNGDNLMQSMNGFYYPIDDILIYDDYTRDKVLGGRLRWDVCDLLHELATNGYRRPSVYKQSAYPNGYFENLTMTDETRFVLLPYTPATGTQNNYQGDEINLKGQFDLVLKLPPVPSEGTYEFRFCTPNNPGVFGMLQFYFGTNKDNLPAIGLPQDCRYRGEAFNQVTGWDLDSNGDPFEIDKQMRLKGYMKPPKHNGMGTTVGPVITTMRVGITDCWRIRRILWTGRVKPTDTYYLRIKNVLTNTEKCCLLDYLEWCPKHVYDAAVAEDEW